MRTKICRHTRLTRQLSNEIARLDRRRWTFEGHDITELLARFQQADDQALYARLCDAARGGDRDAATVALFTVVPELMYDILQNRHGDDDAVDDIVTVAALVIAERPLPAERAITAAIDRSRHRARRAARAWRPDRPYRDVLDERAATPGEACAEGCDLEEGNQRTTISDDPTFDAVAARLELDALPRLARQAVADGTLNPIAWKNLLQRVVLQLPHDEIDPYATQSTIRTRIQTARQAILNTQELCDRSHT